MIAKLSAKTVRESLRAKGFVAEEKRDHEMYFLWLDGSKTSFWVKLSRGVREMRQDEISLNARSLSIRGDDLYRILCCDHDAAVTEQIARARPHL